MLNTAIKQGLNFLISQQQVDGSFLSLTSTKLDDFANADVCHAIVPSNIVLSSLHTLPSTNMSEKIKDKTANFLLTQKSDFWSINYWTRGSDQSKITPYPDDMDDTFCALAALYEHDSSIFNGKAMAKIVTILTATETKEGGPYDMWLTADEEKEKWKRIDLVVNSNIAYFLSLQDVSLPNLTAFIEKSIEDQDYIFPYCSIYPSIYFISRFYKGLKIKNLVDLLLARQQSNGSWGNPLMTALAVSSLCNLSSKKTILIKIKKGVDYLISKQSMEGWEPYSFYVELKTKEETYYSGSSALTTAVCLEAISKYQTIKNGQKNKILGGRAKKIEQQSLNQINLRFSKFSNELETQASKILTKIMKTDKHHSIVLLPYMFSNSLASSSDKINNKLLVSLGSASLYGWMAYTIYDDFLDDEGEPRELSVANVCLRELTVIFENAVSHESKFTSFFHQIMDGIDSANAWEIHNCRFKVGEDSIEIPDYGDFSKLAERSMGHGLGPLIILFILGYSTTSPEVINVLGFFKHYLIARQLNDDLHDWEEDLKKGHINAVGAEILKQARAKKIPYTKIGEDTTVFQEIFWHGIVVNISNEVIEQVKKSRKYLTTITVLENITSFEKLLEKIESSALQTLKERDEAADFLKAYGD